MKISFSVPGVPACAGSKRAFVARGRAIITDANNAKNKPWYSAVNSAAAKAMGDRVPLTGPVYVRLGFTLPRPKSHFGTGRMCDHLKSSAPVNHAQKPDIDKLVRLALDACTSIVWKDDAQVSKVSTWKTWGTAPGMAIEIQELTA